jgi:hypothetical protein
MESAEKTLCLSRRYRHGTRHAVTLSGSVRQNSAAANSIGAPRGYFTGTAEDKHAYTTLNRSTMCKNICRHVPDRCR